MDRPKWHRREFIQGGGLAAALAASVAPAAPAAPAAAAPAPRNIVFILTDDHSYNTLSFMGHPFVQTPNMDSLANNGIHCANAFVTTSLCSPSRASILTGLYAHHHQVVDNNTPVRPIIKSAYP